MKDIHPKIISLPKFDDPRGNLSFIEDENHIPFVIKRVYWIYDVPGGQVREGHAYRKQEELIVALSGSFDVVIDYGRQQQKYHLNRSYFGLYVPAGYWRHLEDFSTNSLAMIISSTIYSTSDYISDYDEYLEFRQS